MLQHIPLRHHTAVLTVAVLIIWVVVATRCITLQHTATRCNTYLSDMILLRLLRRCLCSGLSATASRTGDAEADLSRMSRYISSLSILLKPASTCNTVCEYTSCVYCDCLCDWCVNTCLGCVITPPVCVNTYHETKKIQYTYI